MKRAGVQERHISDLYLLLILEQKQRMKNLRWCPQQTTLLFWESHVLGCFFRQALVVMRMVGSA
jgi:hypothetical protein